MLSSPFETLARRIRQELHDAVQHQVEVYQWTESKKGRALSFQEAWTEWNQAHWEDIGQFLMVQTR